MVKDDGMIELTRGKEKREKVKGVVPAYIYSYVGESSIIFFRFASFATLFDQS